MITSLRIQPPPKPASCLYCSTQSLYCLHRESHDKGSWNLSHAQQVDFELCMGTTWVLSEVMLLWNHQQLRSWTPQKEVARDANPCSCRVIAALTINHMNQTHNLWSMSPSEGTRVWHGDLWTGDCLVWIYLTWPFLSTKLASVQFWLTNVDAWSTINKPPVDNHLHLPSTLHAAYEYWRHWSICPSNHHY